MSAANARVFGVKGIIHRVTPITLRIIPAMGARGMKGHRIRRMRLRVPPRVITIIPVRIRMSREKKPIIREMRRSINMWNLRSRDAPSLADSAEIWRKGLKRVRSSDPMEKKSVILVKKLWILLSKTFQPEEYHHKYISVIAIS